MCCEYDHCDCKCALVSIRNIQALQHAHTTHTHNYNSPTKLELFRDTGWLSAHLMHLMTNKWKCLYAMQRAKSKFLGGKLTWARVADAAVGAVGKAMLGAADAERAIEAAEDAHALAERLQERDAHANARVTAATRTRIGMLDALGQHVRRERSEGQQKGAASRHAARQRRQARLRCLVRPG